MFPIPNRRRFLTSAAAGSALLGLTDLGFLSVLPSISAADAQPDPARVRLGTGIEPLVRLIEDTPRERLLEEIAGKIRGGLAYRDVLTALMLAGVCNVQPRPNVGFKFHAVLVVNSAHLASLAAPDHERWLPLFWALDYFKSAQAQNIKESGWRMKPVDETKVPTARKARAAFTDAMDRWDTEAADAAVAGLARTAGAQEVFELFVRYGARDFRDIGHKAIFVANSWRTLQTVGWHHAEPVLRSLAYAILKHDGTNPSTADLKPDAPGRRNRELSARIRSEWLDGKSDRSATVELLATLRKAPESEVPEKVVTLINSGTAPQSIWDSLLLGATELLLRQPGIVALHAVTTANALRYAYEATASDETRRWLMLQAAAFIPLFRQALLGRGAVADRPIDALEPVESTARGDAVAEIFADVSRDKLTAARKALGFLKSGGNQQSLMDTGRLLVFFKGSDSHDYKFSSALLEDVEQVSPEWRPQFLAAGMMQFRGSDGRDIDLVKRTRAALQA